MKKQVLHKASIFFIAAAIIFGLAPSALAEGKADGFANGNGLDINQIARYDSGMSNPDGGVMEIVDYNYSNNFAYAINGQTGMLTAISLDTLRTSTTVQNLSGIEINVKQLVNSDNFVYGDMTSVAVSPDGTLLAAAIQAQGTNDDGRVALFSCNQDGSLTFIQAIPTGKQPDMVTFTPDGSKLLTANEGEPREGYGTDAIDPAGSVTVIDVESREAQTIGFEQYDDNQARQSLVDQNVVLKKNTAPSVDLEPEYIATNNTTAYITLQEANAIAVLDLETLTYDGIWSVGFENYAEVEIDIDKKDEAYVPQNYDSLYGIRMPDGIALITMDGVDYILTANEGDAREWGDYLNENEIDFGEEGAQSPSGNINNQNSGLTGKVVFFAADDYDGLNQQADYLFGGRTFTLYQVTDNGLRELFTSGSDFEAKTATYLPQYFNCSNDDPTLDDRSGKKGPESETIITGTVGDKTYAFITLERIGGIMVYDITNPQSVAYVNYINSRDFEAFDEENAVMGADNSPEGLKFISADYSPTGRALVLAACEVGGTVAVYELSSDNAAEWGNPFIDVDNNDWYYDAVKYLTSHSIMNGTSDNAFSPNITLNRAMAAQIFYNVNNGTQVENVSFTDISANSWYFDAVNWAAQENIVTGYADGTFAPNKPITKEELVVMVWRVAGSPAIENYNGLDNYQDKDEISTWATNAMAWAHQQNIISGRSDIILAPQYSVTRAESAQIFANYLSLTDTPDNDLNSSQK